jgi:GSH-dependent disulfide-bond oxidoreductase
MIDLYSYGTGNGWRASIALEECGLPYAAHKIDLPRGDQHSAEFRRINPLGKIPVIVDSEGPDGSPITISQSGAILVYCAKKSGRFIPHEERARSAALQWTWHAVSDGSEAIGVLFRALRMPEKPDAVIAIYRSRTAELLEHANRHLEDREFLVGDFSIADIALYTIVAMGKQLIGIDPWAQLQRWFDAMSARPGVVKGMKVPG